MFRKIRKSGRGLMVADGWYGWKKDPKRNQANCIRLAYKDYVFFTAIGQIQPATLEPRKENRFVITTAPSNAGMIDIHDRRPVVLPPDFRRGWVDPELSEDRTGEIGRKEALWSTHSSAIP